MCNFVWDFSLRLSDLLEHSSNFQLLLDLFIIETTSADTVIQIPTYLLFTTAIVHTVVFAKFVCCHSLKNTIWD